MCQLFVAVREVTCTMNTSLNKYRCRKSHVSFSWKVIPISNDLKLKVKHAIPIAETRSSRSTLSKKP